MAETCLSKLLVGRASSHFLYEAHVYRARAQPHSRRHAPKQNSPANTGQAIDLGPDVPLVPVLPLGWQHHYKQGACQLQCAPLWCGVGWPKMRGAAEIFEGCARPVTDLVRRPGYQSQLPACVEAWHGMSSQGQLHSATCWQSPSWVSFCTTRGRSAILPNEGRRLVLMQQNYVNEFKQHLRLNLVQV